MPSTADPPDRPVLSTAAVLEILTYLVTAARTQVDEAREYGPMRLLTGARRLTEQLPPEVLDASGPALSRLLRELGAIEPTATPTRDRTEYVERLDALCALAADALLETHGRSPHPDPS
ncbi:MAG TPA: DUF6092 family protein [Nocardioides sp.]|uniref:DUF6092 family protein n=1 Tax=uncultured Nocardioides sp. TaxID=198441 RepID=UPI00261C6037|nr:DUF6092 family protein [uncultured Nocardioides sp.]HRD61188.1 DUF6092 family protein [Nocardioides sp.]HRI95667.1 DUF6092 family protein [Nocardioides sp.]